MDFNPSFSKITLSNNYVITLDAHQYFFYRTEHIDIHAPDHSYLQTIGYGLKKAEIESTTYRLKEQMYAVECLLCNLSNSLELPAQAISALADLVCRMQGFCREYIK